MNVRERIGGGGKAKREMYFLCGQSGELGGVVEDRECDMVECNAIMTANRKITGGQPKVQSYSPHLRPCWCATAAMASRRWGSTNGSTVASLLLVV